MNFLSSLAAYDGRLIHQVLQIGSGESCGSLGHPVQIHILAQRFSFEWTPRISSRPLTSGRPTATFRSKPARTQNSRVQDIHTVGGRHDDDALIDTKAVHLYQQLVQRLLLSSWPPPIPVPLWRATASISSINTIQGAFFLASSNKSRTRDAPTPTNISTKSEPDMEKNGTPASPATALASRVLPVPGRAHQDKALWDPCADAGVFLRVFKEIHDLLQFFFFFLKPGNLWKVDLCWSGSSLPGSCQNSSSWHWRRLRNLNS